MKNLRQYVKVIILGIVFCFLSVCITYNTADKLFTVYAAGNNTTRGEWMSILVDTFDMVIEDGVVPDDYYGDISTSEYYEDILVAMNFGVIELEAGEDFEPDGVVTREFAAQTLNYCLGFQLDEDAEYTMSDKESLTYAHDAQVAINRGWFELIDGAFSPTTAMTLEEKTAMLADAEAVWESTTVDTTYENTYTFADGVVEVPMGTEVAVSEDGTVSIVDCPVAISENDTFVVYENELPQTYKALTIAENEGTTTITTEAVEFDTVCEDADAQGEIEADLTQAVPITEGVTITYEEESSGTQSAAAYSISRASKKINPITVKYNAGGVQFQCKIDNIKVEYINKVNEKYLGVKGKATLTATAKASKSLSIPLVDVPVAGVGHVTVVMDYSITGTVTLRYTTNFVMGVSYSRNDGFRAVKEFSKGTFSYSAQVDASVSCRVALSAGVQGAISGIIYADVGIKGNATFEAYGDGKSPENCLDLSAYVFVRVGYDVSVLKESWDDAYYIYDKNNTPIRICYHIEDGIGVDSCSRGKTTSSGKKSKYYTSKYSGTSASGDRTTISTYCDSGFIGDDTVTVYEYTTDDEGNATITKYNGCAYSLIIPDEIDGYPVTAIGSSAFKNNTYIVSVVIPDGVTSIGSSAFYGCTNLETVVMPDSVTSIKDYVFYNCKKLDEIDIPMQLVTLYGDAFGNCLGLEEITIPKSLDNVYNGGPFTGCTNLKKINFEKGTTKIVGSLFQNCPGIEEIIIPETITLIEWGAFYGCSNLTKVEIPDSVTSIGGSAFYKCSSLQEIDIPNTVTSMQTYTFSGCTSLQKAHLPDIRINLMDCTFENCTSLTEVNFPETLETIGSSAFYNCTSLTEVNLPSKVNTINSSAFYGCTGLTKVTIPASMRTINSSAFSHCEALTDLTIAEGVTTIYSNAFEYCKALEKVTLPDSLQTFGSYAFRYCDALSEVNIGAGLKVIPSYCFYEDPALEKIVLPQQVTTVNSYAFGNCTKFADITMNRNVSTITANAFSYPDNLTIRGISGTYPETFATENEITFVALNTPATAIKLNATEKRLARGYTAQMTANITPADSSDQLTWTSTDEDIVTVDANGQIKGIATGTATIIAMAGDVMEFCEVTVYEKVTSVYISGSSATLMLGETYQLSATVYPSSATNKNITWTTSDEKVATVDDTGLITAVAYGTATITVTTEDSGYTDTFTVTIEPIAVTGVSLNAKTAVVGVNSTYQLVATIAPENATVQDVTWTSSKPAVATVENGLVTGVSEGTAIIIVKTADGAKTASCTITVKDLSVTGITLDKTELELETKTSYQLTESILPTEATNKNVTWTSDNEKIATVQNGKVNALKAGTATITVTTEDGGYTASCVVTVVGKDVTGVTLSKEILSMEVGNCAYVEAFVAPADADNTSVTWITSDESVASIDSTTGVITANAVGTTTIKAITNDGGYEASCEVTVVMPEDTEDTVKVTGITIHSLDEEIHVGDSFALSAAIEPDTATNQDIIWLSSNTDVAKISQDGEVTTYTIGEVTFTAISVDGGKSAEYTIEVLPIAVTGVELESSNVSLTVGDAEWIDYVIYPGDASNQDVTWSSSNKSVATVSASGRIQALRVGTTTITITTEDGGYEDSCVVNVSPVWVNEIELSENTLALAVGDAKQLSATVYPSNATDRTVAWYSSNPSVATVSENGKVTAIAEGTANIIVEANDGSGVESVCVVAVTKKQESTQPTPEPQAPQQTVTEQPPVTEVLPIVGTVTTLSSGQFKVTKSSDAEKEVTFVKPKNSKKASVSIPATVTIEGHAYKVTAIADKAFKNNKKLKSVTIGKYVTKIGKEAFRGCKKLKKITIKSAVLKSVGKNAIKGIDKKATIKVPKKQLSKYKKLFKSKTGYKKTMKIKK